jgi:hypothetical protein
MRARTQHDFIEPAASTIVFRDHVAAGLLIMPMLMVFFALGLIFNEDSRSLALWLAAIAAVTWVVFWPLALVRVKAVQEVFRHGMLCKGIVRELAERRRREGTVYDLHFAYRMDGRTYEKTLRLPHDKLHLGELNQLEVLVDPDRPRRAFIPDMFV